MYYLAHTGSIEEGHNHMWDGGSSMGVETLFLLLLLTALAVLIAVVFMKALSGRDSRDSSPEAIVKERYAKGEINQKEYKELLKDLKK